jgi:hypothetical protein
MSKGTPVEQLISEARAEGNYVESLVVGAYWGPRPEAPDGIARRVLAMVAGLEELGVTGGEPWWHDDTPLPLDQVALTEQVARGVNRSNANHAVMKDLGYRVSGYTGPAARDDLGVSVMIHAGSTGTRSGNSVVVKPCRLEDREVLIAQAGGAVRLLAQVWAPDWAIFTRTDLRDAVRGGTPYPGAITWLAGRDGASLAGPGAEAGPKMQQVAGGTLIDLTNDGALPAADEVVALRDRLVALGWVPAPRPAR